MVLSLKVTFRVSVLNRVPPHVSQGTRTSGKCSSPPWTSPAPDTLRTAPLDIERKTPGQKPAPRASGNEAKTLRMSSQIPT